MAFCIAETHAIAGRPLRVSGIIGWLRQARRGNDGLARDLGGDERAGLFERIGVDGEKRLRVLAGESAERP
jgi:hypothetical protein